MAFKCHRKLNLLPRQEVKSSIHQHTCLQYPNAISLISLVETDAILGKAPCVSDSVISIDNFFFLSINSLQSLPLFPSNCHNWLCPQNNNSEQSLTCFCLYFLIYKTGIISNQNYNEVSPHSSQNVIIKMSTNNEFWRECREHRTLLHCWWEWKLV